MPHLTLRLLGSLQVEVNGRAVTHFATQRAKALLIYLGAAGGAVMRDSVAGLLWPDKEESRARVSLRQCLRRLRRDLAPHAEFFIQASRTSLALNPECVSVDLHLFADHLNAAERLARAHGSYSLATAERLEQAAELVRGSFLQDFGFEGSDLFGEWQHKHQQLWEERIFQLTHRLARLYTHERLFAKALTYAQQMVALEPWQENGWLLLIEALWHLDERGAALNQYHLYQTQLQAELHIEPGEEMQRLYARLTQTSRGGSRSRPARLNFPARARNFVDRQPEQAELLAHLEQPDSRLVNIVGTAGIGKTALALEVVQQLSSHRFPGGMAFVDCHVDCDLPARLEQTWKSLELTASSGIQTPNQPDFQLILLDSFAVHQSNVRLVQHFLVQHPQVSLLITSHEPLQLRSEWRILLDGLPLGAYPNASPACELFWRAASRWSNLRPSPAQQRSAYQICRLLGGHPLAIEQAAACLRIHAVESLLHQIERGLDFLVTPLRDVPPRQRSLLQALDGAWHSLPTPEQQLWSALAGFSKTFRWEDARSRTGGRDRDFVRLIERGLVRQTADGRFDLNPLLRRYAAEKQLVSSTADV